MVEYILEVYTRDATAGTYTRIGELTTFSDLTWTKKDNRPKSASFNLNVYSPDTTLIQPFKHWILIKRNGYPEFFGNIIDVRGQLFSDTGSISVQCADVLYSLKQFYSDPTYTAVDTDAGLIAEELISLIQARDYGNFGIQSGTIETIGVTNQTLYYQSLGGAIIDQSDNIVDYHFEFVPILDADGKMDYIKFNVFKSTGVTRTDLPPLELGLSVNTIHFGMKGEVFNQIFTLGSDTGDVEVTESSALISQQTFGRREIVNKEPSVAIRETLQQKGDTFLNDAQGVELDMSFELTEGVAPYYGDFNLMDTLPINIQIADTFFSFEGTVQIKELTFTYDTNTNKETISAIVSYYKV